MEQKIFIKEVKTKREFLEFVRFPFSLYRDNPYWVPPLIKDEMETIDPAVNPVY